MQSLKRILLVEDDARLSTLLAELLTAEGYDVTSESRGDTAAARILAEQPDLVLLDIGLPGLDGLSVCRAVRPAFRGRILMLTARGEESDEVAGLDLGADDYLAKPAAPSRLLARVRALLRRAPAPAETPEETTVLRNGPLVVDPARRVVEMNGVPVALTTAEFELLWLLVRRAGEIISRDELYQTLRGFDYDGLDRSIDLRVSRLRRYLGDDPRKPEIIKTVRGTGYLLVRARS